MQVRSSAMSELIRCQNGVFGCFPRRFNRMASDVILQVSLRPFPNRYFRQRRFKHLQPPQQAVDELFKVPS